MLFKRILFLGLVSGMYALSSAQSLSPQVIASSGAHLSSAGAQLSYTIGEPLTQTFNAGSVVVTQGFHQPETNTSGLHENEIFVFQVYPNPSENYIIISTKETGIDQFKAEFTNDLGQVIYTGNLTGNNQQIDISAFAAGHYYLRLTYNGHQTNSFTIIKSSTY